MASTSRILFVAALAVATILSAAHAQDEAEWLAAHNAARSAVSVEPLVWNGAAAAHATEWMESQTARADCPALDHSPSETWGENLAYAGADSSTPTTIVGLWVAEQQWYDYASDECNAPDGKFCGHYTQVVWNTTTSVGCPSGPCATDETSIYYICNYYPRGNGYGKRPY